MRRAVRWYRNTVFEGGIYYGTIQRHRHELCSLQRPCGKAVNKVPGVTSCSVSLLTNSMGVEGTASASAIVSAVEEAGYGCSLKGASGQTESVSDAEKALEDHETPLLRKRLIASVGFLLVLMYFSMGHMMWGWPLPAWFDGNHIAMGLVQLLLAGIVMVINQKFFISGFRSLWHRSPNMDTW